MARFMREYDRQSDSGISDRTGMESAARMAVYVLGIIVIPIGIFLAVQVFFTAKKALGDPKSTATKLTDWARENAESLGRKYRSELARRRNRQEAYENL